MIRKKFNGIVNGGAISQADTRTKNETVRDAKRKQRLGGSGPP